MFDRLQDRMLAALRNMAKSGRLSEEDVAAGLREIRLALLEADVSLPVVRDFVAAVRAKAVGQQVQGELNAAETLIKIVYDELTALLGGEDFDPTLRLGTGTAKIMLAGLQGSGKTTTAAKLALKFKSEGKRPLLVAADLSRPAAIDQLEVLAGQVGVAFHTDRGGNPVAIAKEGLARGIKEGLSPVIIDTAGRLSIDEALMDELVQVRAAVQPDETLLVLDALTGQDAVETAKRFDEKLNLTGLILTKTDGDARGGAALSMRAATGKPIRLLGTGEKVEALEYFHPARMASRILGRGDIMSLIERAAGAIDEEEAAKLEAKLRKTKKFDLEDFLLSLRQMQKMGSMRQLMSFIPGMRLTDEQVDAGQQQLKQFEAIVHSMTRAERRDPRLLNASRRRRIAAGSGTSVPEINVFIGQFRQMQQMTSQLLGSRGMRNMGRGGAAGAGDDGWDMDDEAAANAPAAGALSPGGDSQAQRGSATPAQQRLAMQRPAGSSKSATKKKAAPRKKRSRR
jgi:signal recognition particle subunit SRP54